MALTRKILYPFSLMYGGVMLLRNTLYDTEVFKSSGYDLPVICVGNLSVGGTGKSPMVEYLVSLLKQNMRVATLSRGYKRTSSSFLLLGGNESATETGDEPLQFKIKFPEVAVAVDESRCHGIEELIALNPPPEVIILDDAFQHRKVTAGLNILLTPYNSLYSKDFLLPAGNLREPVSGAKRAQIVIVTKCPAHVSGDEKEQIGKELKVGEDQELFFSRVSYSGKAFSAKSIREINGFRETDFTLVTGIANPTPLVQHLNSLGLNFKHLKFPDHHNFRASEIKEIGTQPLLLTTEKDFMRLKGSVPEEKLFYLPIKTEFLRGGSRFDELIRTFAIKK